MLTAVVVDDETHCVEDLLYLLEKEKLPVSVLATANSATDGIDKIQKCAPDIVFLDIVMPGKSGFEMLAGVSDLNFHLIITTSVDNFAIQAIRASAIDYLVKPVKAGELTQAVQKVITMKEAPVKQQIHLLQEQLQTRRPVSKIALPVSDGIQLVKLAEIIFLKSDGNYTYVNFTNGKPLLVSRQIGKFEDMLPGDAFFRIHASYIVNMQHVEKYTRGEGGHLLMTNGEVLPVSRTKKDLLLNVLAGF